MESDKKHTTYSSELVQMQQPWFHLKYFLKNMFKCDNGHVAGCYYENVETITGIVEGRSQPAKDPPKHHTHALVLSLKLGRHLMNVVWLLMSSAHHYIWTNTEPRTVMLCQPVVSVLERTGTYRSVLMYHVLVHRYKQILKKNGQKIENIIF